MSCRRGGVLSCARRAYAALQRHRCAAVTHTRCVTTTATTTTRSVAAAAAATPTATTRQRDDDVIAATRNIGIVAHIDAGKTTTTERMLYYAGVVRRVGDVDSGTTVTDFLPEEMERGITIQSAAVSLQWRAHTINLIDTPGHVDFTVEVERAMRVVDGVVALFDAAVGVQAQSYTVLQQSRKFAVPVLAFVNKMDKLNANFDRAVASLREKLHVTPLLLQRPLLAADGHFEGVLDVAALTTHRFGGVHGAQVDVRDLLPSSASTTSTHGEDAHVLQMARAARHTLLAQLTRLDDALAETLIAAIDDAGGDEAAAEQRVSAQAVRAAVRRVLLRPYHDYQHTDSGNSSSRNRVDNDDDDDSSSCHRDMVVPVLCGAARRDQGVQPLLDAVVDLLPSPRDRALCGYSATGRRVRLPPATAAATVPVLALAFKVTHMPGPHGKRQALVYLRVYSGKLTPRMTLYNHTRRRHNNSNSNSGNSGMSTYDVRGQHNAAAIAAAVAAARSGAAGSSSSSYAAEGVSERVDKLYVMHADRPVEVPYLLAGQIGAAFLKHACTGDTLYAPPPVSASPRRRVGSNNNNSAGSGASSAHDARANATAADNNNDDDDDVHTLEGIDAPPAVISFSLEPTTQHDAEQLHTALAALTREDPSLRVRHDDDGHVVLSGMGELHLDIALSRLRREHQASCRLLRAVIEYRETVTCVHAVPAYVAQHAGAPYIECTLQLRPRLHDDGATCDVHAGCVFVVDDDLRARYTQHDGRGNTSSSSSSHQQQQQMRMADVRNATEELRCIEACFREAVAVCGRLGPRTGAPLHGMYVVLTSLRKAGGAVELQARALAPAARAVVLHALHAVPADAFALLEPTMAVDVHLSESAYVSGVVKSLNQHHALTIDVCSNGDDDNGKDNSSNSSSSGHVVRALVALRNCVRYTTELRKVVKGHASLQMRLHHYRVVDDAAVLERILRNRGVAATT